MKKYIALALAVLLVGALFVGCSKSSAGGFAGTYVNEHDSKDVFVLNADRTLNYSYSTYYSASGTWSLSGNKLSVTLDGQTYTCTVNGTSFSIEGETYVKQAANLGGSGSGSGSSSYDYAYDEAKEEAVEVIEDTEYYGGGH